MTKKIKSKLFNNDAWIKAHFEEIIEQYAGEHIIVSNGEIFRGDDAIEKAKKKYPDTIPTSMPVPRPKDFTHIL